MGIFNKRKGKTNNEADAASNSKVNMKRKKKGNSLSPSVPEAMIELLNKNVPFIVGSDPRRTVGAAVTISEAIGDLNDKKNENIGQIISYINNSTISAIVLEPLLEDDTLIIIPNADTLATMRAYDSFKNATYQLCYVDLDAGKIEPCENEDKLTFGDIENIANGRERLADILGLNGGDDDEDDDDDEDIDEYDDDVSNDDLFNGANSPDEYDNEPEPDDEFSADVPSTDDYESYNEFDEPEPELEFEPEPEPEPEDEYSETTDETIMELSKRVFMVDDIELEISDEPFDNQFNTRDLVLFTETRPTDEGDGIVNHLNECLNNMSKVANAEIKQARNTHINDLRTEYFGNLSEFVRTCINAELSTVGDTASAIARAEIEAHHNELLNNINNEIDERKRIIDVEYNEAIETVRLAAATAAEAEYRETHKKQYIAQLDSIRNQIEQEIEHQYTSDIAAQNSDRHKRAIEMLDDTMSIILDQLSTKYADMVADENKIYQKHMEAMLEFMSSQRYNEMNRIRVLQDEHARTDIAEKMAAKHASDVAEITAKFNAQKKSLEANLQSMRENLDIAINRATADAERKIADLRSENQRLIEKADKATAKLESADERAESKYVNEIESLHNQIARWEDESTKLHNGQKTSIFIMLGLSIAAVIAACAIGFISGQSHQAKQYQDTVIQNSYTVPGNQSGNNDSNNNDGSIIQNNNNVDDIDTNSGRVMENNGSNNGSDY